MQNNEKISITLSSTGKGNHTNSRLKRQVFTQVKNYQQDFDFPLQAKLILQLIYDMTGQMAGEPEPAVRITILEQIETLMPVYELFTTVGEIFANHE